MPGITDLISTVTFGATEKVTVKRYGDGTIAFTPQLLTSVTTTSGSPNLASVTSTNGIRVGDPITGTGIAAGSYVGSFVANTSIAMVDSAGAAKNATASATVTATINKAHNVIGERRTQGDQPREGWVSAFISALLIVA